MTRDAHGGADEYVSAPAPAAIDEFVMPGETRPCFEHGEKSAARPGRRWITHRGEQASETEGTEEIESHFEAKRY